MLLFFKAYKAFPLNFFRLEAEFLPSLPVAPDFQTTTVILVFPNPNLLNTNMKALKKLEFRILESLNMLS